MVDQRPGQGDPLLLAPGQLARAALLTPGQVDDLQHLGDLAGDLCPGDTLAAEPEGHVLSSDGEPGERDETDHPQDQRRLAQPWPQRARRGPPQQRPNHGPAAIVTASVIDRAASAAVGRVPLRRSVMRRLNVPAAVLGRARLVGDPGSPRKPKPGWILFSAAR